MATFTDWEGSVARRSLLTSSGAPKYLRGGEKQEGGWFRRPFPAVGSTTEIGSREYKTELAVLNTSGTRSNLIARTIKVVPSSAQPIALQIDCNCNFRVHSLLRTRQ